MPNLNYVCPKCKNTSFEPDEIRTTGSGFSRFFDVQNRVFTTVTCTKCGYTELYKGKSSGIGNILDFITH
jgi:uncharacterized protein